MSTRSGRTGLKASGLAVSNLSTTISRIPHRLRRPTVFSTGLHLAAPIPPQGIKDGPAGVALPTVLRARTPQSLAALLRSSWVFVASSLSTRASSPPAFTPGPSPLGSRAPAHHSPLTTLLVDCCACRTADSLSSLLQLRFTAFHCPFRAPKRLNPSRFDTLFASRTNRSGRKKARNALDDVVEALASCLNPRGLCWPWGRCRGSIDDGGGA